MNSAELPEKNVNFDRYLGYIPMMHWMPVVAFRATMQEVEKYRHNIEKNPRLAALRLAFIPGETDDDHEVVSLYVGALPEIAALITKEAMDYLRRELLVIMQGDIDDNVDGEANL